MSITNHAELLTAIQTWMARSDSDLTGSDDDFVTLCEARIHYGSGDPGEPFFSPPLRIRAMETSGDLTINAQTTSLPDGYLRTRRVYIDTDPKGNPSYYPPDDFWAKYAFSAAGRIVAYTIEGDSFTWGPTPDATYTGKLLYWKKFDALSDGANWLITNVPNLYLYGSLLEASIWDKNDTEATKYHALFMGVIRGLHRSDQMDRFPQSDLAVRSDFVAV